MSSPCNPKPDTALNTIVCGVLGSFDPPSSSIGHEPDDADPLTDLDPFGADQQTAGEQRPAGADQQTDGNDGGADPIDGPGDT